MHGRELSFQTHHSISKFLRVNSKLRNGQISPLTFPFQLQKVTALNDLENDQCVLNYIGNMNSKVNFHSDFLTPPPWKKKTVELHRRTIPEQWSIFNVISELATPSLHKCYPRSKKDTKKDTSLFSNYSIIANNVEKFSLFLNNDLRRLTKLTPQFIS